jgi:hypothetical protein
MPFHEMVSCVLKMRRAIAQAVSYQLPTTADQVRSQVMSGGGFLRVLHFPLPILIPLILSLSHLDIDAI